MTVLEPIKIISAILTSLSASSATSACVSVVSSAVIGIVSSFCFDAAVKLLEKLEIDDPLFHVQIHFSGGVCGLLCLGIFH